MNGETTTKGRSPEVTTIWRDGTILRVSPWGRVTELKPLRPIAETGIIWSDPFLSAEKCAALPHSSVRVVAMLGNSIDGSGAWVGIHLLNSAGEFIQGGWVRDTNTKASKSGT